MVKEQSYSKINWNMGDVQWKLKASLYNQLALLVLLQTYGNFIYRI